MSEEIRRVSGNSVEALRNLKPRILVLPKFVLEFLVFQRCFCFNSGKSMFLYCSKSNLLNFHVAIACKLSRIG